MKWVSGTEAKRGGLGYENKHSRESLHMNRVVGLGETKMIRALRATKILRTVRLARVFKFRALLDHVLKSERAEVLRERFRCDRGNGGQG